MSHEPPEDGDGSVGGQAEVIASLGLLHVEWLKADQLH